jgi:NitT/TauT family transport system ATP-binding protein
MNLENELANTAPERIEATNITKSFTTERGTVVALDNVSVKVGEGEFLCLVGPSGCGKSTLLNLIAGLDRPDSGSALGEWRDHHRSWTRPHGDVSGARPFPMARCHG